ncbi:MAG: hypothetical protein AAF417_19605, partial [Pseudomonadota bacterium]
SRVLAGTTSTRCSPSPRASPPSSWASRWSRAGSRRAPGSRRVNPSADLDEETLTDIAELTGGRYFRAKDTAALQDIYRLLDEMEPVAEPEAGFRPVKSLYFWPLGGALVLVTLLAVASALAGLDVGRRVRALRMRQTDAG